jgi:hypothetical protein
VEQRSVPAGPVIGPTLWGAKPLLAEWRFLMESVARAIAGAAILLAGVLFTLFGAERGFDGIPGFLVGMLGVALDALGLFILLRVAGILPLAAREARGFEVATANPPA